MLSSRSSAVSSISGLTLTQRSNNSQASDKAATKKPPKPKTVKRAPTEMRKCYERGDLPFSVLDSAGHPSGGSLLWEVEPDLLDYETYLPMLFGGLVEVEEPFALFARRGILDMLQHGEDEAIAEAVPLCIPHIRLALLTEDTVICVTAIESLQALLRAGKESAKAVLPFLKQLLPALRRLMRNPLNQEKHDDKALDSLKRGVVDLSTIVEETLNLLNRYGGPNAFKVIKAMVPMYTGC